MAQQDNFLNHIHIVLRQRNRIEAYCLNPESSIGGSDDYDTYGFLEWSATERKWIGYGGGRSYATDESYVFVYSVEDSDSLQQYIIDYLKNELKKTGLEIDWEKFMPIAHYNLEDILNELANEGKITKLARNRFKLKDGRIVLLKIL